jgi:hypothetical protein
MPGAGYLNAVTRHDGGQPARFLYAIALAIHGKLLTALGDGDAVLKVARKEATTARGGQWPTLCGW